MIKNYLLRILLLLLPCFTLAQSQSTNIDRLTTALKNADNDSVKMIALFNLAGYYAESNSDSCMFFANRGTEVAKKIHQQLWIAHFITEYQSFIAMVDGNFPLSFKLINDALKLVQNDDNEKNVFIPSDYEFRDPHKFRLSQEGYSLLFCPFFLFCLSYPFFYLFPVFSSPARSPYHFQVRVMIFHLLPV